MGTVCTRGPHSRYTLLLDSPRLQFPEEKRKNHFFGELASDVRDHQGNGLIRLYEFPEPRSSSRAAEGLLNRPCHIRNKGGFMRLPALKWNRRWGRHRG